jgi:hypothetical protein
MIYTHVLRGVRSPLDSREPIASIRATERQTGKKTVRT